MAIDVLETKTNQVKNYKTNPVHYLCKRYKNMFYRHFGHTEYHATETSLLNGLIPSAEIVCRIFIFKKLAGNK